MKIYAAGCARCMAGGDFVVQLSQGAPEGAGDEPGTGGRQVFHRSGESTGCDIIYFRRTSLAKGDDIKSALDEACGEE